VHNSYQRFSVGGTSIVLIILQQQPSDIQYVRNGESILQISGTQVQRADHCWLRENRLEVAPSACVLAGSTATTEADFVSGSRAQVRSEQHYPSRVGHGGRRVDGVQTSQTADHSYTRPGRVQHSAVYARYQARHANVLHRVSTDIHTYVHLCLYNQWHSNSDGLGTKSHTKYSRVYNKLNFKKIMYILYIRSVRNRVRENSNIRMIPMGGWYIYYFDLSTKKARYLMPRIARGTFQQMYRYIRIAS